MKVGDLVKMAHPGKRDGEVGIILATEMPLRGHQCDPCKCGVHLDIRGELWAIHRNFVEVVKEARQ